MKAVYFEAHGAPENYRYADFADPRIEPDECLVKVHAVALNGFDPMILRGIPGLKTPLPMIPGADIAGEVVAVGESDAARRWKIGDRVTVIPNQHDGMVGETRRGGASELYAARAAYLLPIPDGVNFVDAAALPTAYGAALRMMEARGQVKRGERVLILGASGGVGTCCVQIAKAAGCEVIACASSAWKLDRLKQLGADHVIDTATQDFVKAVHAICGKPRTRGTGGGVDVAVNYTGGDTWAQTLRTVRRDGRILTCGASAGFDPKTDLRYIWSFELNIVGSNGWTVEDQVELLRRVADGRLKPVIDSVRPLADFRTSFDALANREVFGKAVLTP
jgi:alcohol dehydrogenase